jgi:hypothetical protein
MRSSDRPCWLRIVFAPALPSLRLTPRLRAGGRPSPSSIAIKREAGPDEAKLTVPASMIRRHRARTTAGTDMRTPLELNDAMIATPAMRIALFLLSLVRPFFLTVSEATRPVSIAADPCAAGLNTAAGQPTILAGAAGMRLADDVNRARSRHRTAQVGDAA